MGVSLSQGVRIPSLARLVLVIFTEWPQKIKLFLILAETITFSEVDYIFHARIMVVSDGSEERKTDRKQFNYLQVPYCCYGSLTLWMKIYKIKAKLLLHTYTYRFS